MHTRNTAVALLHGLGGCSADWGDLPDRLGGTVVAFDAPAHGGRPLPDEPLDFRLLAADTLAALDERGIEHCVLVGCSMGAATALTIASLAPRRVTALLLLAPAWWDDPEPANLRPLRKIGRRLRRDGAPSTWRLLSKLPPYDGWTPSERARYAERYFRLDEKAVGTAMVDLPAQLPVVARALGDGSGPPTIVATWRHDPIHPESLARQVASGLCARPPLVLDRPRTHDAEVRLVQHFVGHFRDTSSPRGGFA